MKTKIVPIAFFVIILSLGFAAIKFYSDKTTLSQENEELGKAKASLVNGNNVLQNNCNNLETDKRNLEERLSRIQGELSRLDEERNNWRDKYNDISQQRDMLAEQLRAKPPEVRVVERREEKRVPQEGELSEDYWADFIRKKAQLEASLERFRDEIMEAKSKIAQIDKENKELSIKIDELTKEREEHERKMALNKRTMDIMSRDLVRERTAKKDALDRTNQLRGENVQLKRELILANKEKLQVHNKIKETREQKEVLEKRVSQIENILKDKSLVFEELQEEFTQVIKGDTDMTLEESASVELPPIIVNPVDSRIKGLRGEVIAVNQEEKFIIIDIGASSGIRPGVQMRVMRKGREIGSVEVIEARKDISAADIKEMVGDLTVQEGDVVVSK